MNFFSDFISAVSLLCAACGGAFLYRSFTEEKRRMPRCVVVDYRVPDGANISVHACACICCKNVIWAQRVEIDVPKFCAYCGVEFNSVTIASDAEMRERGMIIPD